MRLININISLNPDSYEVPRSLALSLTFALLLLRAFGIRDPWNYLNFYNRHALSSIYANIPMSLLSLSPFLSLSLFVGYASSNFIIEHLLRLSWFLETSQITEIKGAPVSLEDTPASCFRARSLFSYRTLNCSTKQLTQTVSLV